MKISESIAKSPQTATILKSKGIILSPEDRNSMQAGQKVMETIQTRLFESKSKGGYQKAGLNAYKQIKHLVQAAPNKSRQQVMTFTKKYFKIRSGLKIKKFKKWWENDE